jgi:hypothetical protein
LFPVPPNHLYAIHWTLNEQTSLAQTLPLSVYIDFKDVSLNTKIPYIINEASGGAIMVSSTSNVGPLYNQTTSVTDFVDLNTEGATLYCNLYQMGDASQTDNTIDRYKMSLTMIQITEVTIKPGYIP